MTQIAHMQPLVSSLYKSELSKLLCYNLLYWLSLDEILLGFFGKNNSCMAPLHSIMLSGRGKSCGIYMSRYKIILNKWYFCVVVMKV
jgi:hypothetical protein